MTQPSWAIGEQVRKVSTQRIAGQLGAVDTATLSNVARVLRYLLNL